MFDDLFDDKEMKNKHEQNLRDLFERLYEDILAEGHKFLPALRSTSKLAPGRRVSKRKTHKSYYVNSSGLTAFWLNPVPTVKITSESMHVHKTVLPNLM